MKKIDVIFRRAILYTKKGDINRAIIEYKKVLQMNKNHFNAWNDLGAAYLQKKNYNEAIKYLKRALKINNQSYIAWSNLGLVYFHLRQFNNSLKCLNKSIAINNSYPSALINLARVHHELREYEEEIRILNRLLNLKPNLTRMWIILGDAYVNTQNFHKAIESLEKALKSEPHNSVILEKLSKLYEHIGQSDKALEILSELENMTSPLIKPLSNQVRPQNHPKYRENQKFSIDFDMRIKDFKFFNEILIKGKHKISKSWEKARFEHQAKWNISKSLISKGKRKINFQFKLKMQPDFGEIMFEGECTLESPEQAKISFVMQNAPQVLDNFAKNFILKFSFLNAEKFAKEQKILFPPVRFILRKLGIE